MLCFAIVTFVSAFLLSDCYRSPHPVTGTRNIERDAELRARMYFAQKKIGRWTKKWMVLRVFSAGCLLVSLLALIGSVEGLVSEKLG